MKTSFLSDKLLERVLPRLGFTHRLEPNLENLRRLYAAWCQLVPFDNVRKLIHVRAGFATPLPGSTPEDFFEAWLAHGTGGTCWAGAGGFHALLVALGFTAQRGVATMLVVPDLPPNHGTVRVTLGAENFLVDCSILHGEPLRLDTQVETSVKHPAWGVRCAERDGRWHVTWRPLHKLDGFECRLEYFGAELAEFQKFYNDTRGWSPFNYEVTARLNRGDRVFGVAFGKAVSLEGDGNTHEQPISQAERRRVLIEEMGFSEAIINQLPDDIATPPPPGSRTAQVAGVM
jgi:N-hydroxyarylamine O-acetyltransferase